MNDKCLSMVEFFLDNSANSNYNSIAKANLDEKFVLRSIVTGKQIGRAHV